MDIQLSGRNDGEPTTFLTTDYVTMDLTIQAEGTLDFTELGLDSLGSDSLGGGQ